MDRSRYTAMAAAIGLTLVTSGAHAAITVHSSQASFLGAVSFASTHDLNNIPLTTFPNLPGSPYLLSTAGNPGWGYFAVASAGLLYHGVNPGGYYLTTIVPTAALTFTFFPFSGPVAGGATAIGGLFFGSDATGTFLPGQALTLIATDTEGSTSVVLNNTTQTTFAGFTSSTKITSLSVSATQGTNPVWVGVDNLVLAVPEASSYQMLIAGLLVIGRAVRRRASAGAA